MGVHHPASFCPISASWPSKEEVKALTLDLAIFSIFGFVLVITIVIWIKGMHTYDFYHV